VPLVAGVDCSTQSTKVVVVDADTGELKGTGSSPHAVTGSGGARESDPREWEVALAAALAAAGRTREVAAISVAGQQHGLVVVDAAGAPLRPAILWNDVRSAADADLLVARLGGPAATARLVGSVLTASFTVTSWAFLRRVEPETAARAAAVRLPHDHLHACLTGRAVTDRSDVSGTGWWSPAEGDYAREVLDLDIVRLGVAQLPEVLGPFDVAGPVHARAAARYGLRPDCLVGAGLGDNAAAALAVGPGPGEAVVSLGTSGTVFAVAESAPADETGVVAGFASGDGRFLPLACVNNATLAVDRVAGWLGCDREAVAPAGSVLFLPWLDGERTPNAPTASGTLTGLRHDTPPGAILQAAYDGVVSTLLSATDRLTLWAPQREDAALVVVGGGARGRVWQETLRRLSGRPLLVPPPIEHVAYGAALQAALALDGASGSGGVGLEDLDARRLAWGLRRGEELAPVPRDEARVAELAAFRQAVLASLVPAAP